MTKKKEGAKMGRPSLLNPDEQTIKTIHGLAGIQCTQKQAASVLGVNEQTFADFLQRHIKAREAWDLGQSQGLAGLRQSQFAQSKRSAPMAIFLGKQYLGQTDKHEVGGMIGGLPIGIEVSADEGLTALLWAAKHGTTKKEEEEK